MPMSNRSALFKAIETTSLDAIVTIDETGHILSFNPAAERMFGYGEAELLGQNVKVLMPQHFRDHHDGYLQSYRETGERKIIGIGRVVAGERKDGASFPLELSVGEALIEGQRIFVGFLRDLTVTEREHRRVQELQSDLFHVSRLSEMGQIASGLAHEVNQPLGAIMNFAQAGRDLLAAPGAAESVARVLDRIDGEANRAAEIIRRLRAFIEKRETDRHDENLHSLIEESLALALVGPTGARLHIATRLAAPDPLVHVDKVQIQQVLVNLIRNAVDAMEGKAERRLAIASRARACAGPDGAGIEVTVSDNGHGIAPAVADRLFGAFVTTKENGMGVGLSISRAIIEAHGGRLWFENGRHGGTVFHFTLPGAPARPKA